MAKFCTKCGKPLVEGEICSCSINTVNEYKTPVENTVDENNVNNVSNNDSYVDNNQGNNGNVNNVGMTANVALENTKNVAVDLWKLMVNVIKRPFTTSKEYVTSNDNIMAFILIVLQGIFTGLLVLTVISRLFGEILGGLKKIASSAIDVNPFGNFMVGLLVSIALSFIYALILFVVTMIFDSNANFMICVRTIAIRSVVMIFATIITIVLGLISAKIGIFVGLIIVPIVGFIYILAAIKSFVTIDEDKFTFYILVFVIISLVVYYIVAYKIGFFNIPIIRTAKNGLSGVTSLLNNFSSKGSSISGLFN